MNEANFIYRCNELTIYPEFAYENERIKKALDKRDYKKAMELLETEF